MMGVLVCERGLPEYSACRGAGEVGRVQTTAVLECRVGTVHVYKGVQGGLGL